MSDVAPREDAPVVEEMPARIEVKVWHAVTYVMEGDQLVVGPDQVYQGGPEAQMINSTTGRVVEQKTTPVTEESVAEMLAQAEARAKAEAVAQPVEQQPASAAPEVPVVEAPVMVEVPVEAQAVEAQVEEATAEPSPSGLSRSRRL
jgi:hypothetical protein